ncbi:hypothetical protein OY671_010716, partial [Metschnikowia pulcherrima]
HRLHRRGHRRGAPEDRRARRPSDRGDRRPADGRHEHRWRPVRIGQDVPAAGGQVRARDEEGGGAPDPVHRGGEGRRLQGQGPHRDGHGQGRRARYRQEHRRRDAAVQRLRGDRPGRDGAVGDDPAGRQRERGRHHRPLGPHHPLARRDGDRGRGNAARRHDHPAADRRGHHQ